MTVNLDSVPWAEGTAACRVGKIARAGEKSGTGFAGDFAHAANRRDRGAGGIARALRRSFIRWTAQSYSGASGLIMVRHMWLTGVSS
jgi:hypothetical protein